MKVDMRLPEPGEYATFYQTYIGLITQTDIVSLLKTSGESALKFYQGIPEDKWHEGYAPGKWTLKEAVVHVIDTEQIFAYRALRVARGDKTPLAGFDQDSYVPLSGANDRTIFSILEEYEAIRKTSYLMFKNFDADMWDRMGTASDHPISVRALAFMIAGHELHHLNITKERYL